MARIAGVNVPDNKHADIALTAIYGLEEQRRKTFVNLLALMRQLKSKI